MNRIQKIFEIFNLFKKEKNETINYNKIENKNFENYKIVI